MISLENLYSTLSPSEESFYTSSNDISAVLNTDKSKRFFVQFMNNSGKIVTPVPEFFRGINQSVIQEFLKISEYNKYSFNWASENSENVYLDENPDS